MGRGRFEPRKHETFEPRKHEMTKYTKRKDETAKGGLHWWGVEGWAQSTDYGNGLHGLGSRWGGIGWGRARSADYWNGLHGLGSGGGGRGGAKHIPIGLFHVKHIPLGVSHK